MSVVGTWAWAQATHGQLRGRDRAELIRQAALARVGLLLESRRSGPAGLSLEVPDPPDSALARSAEECARELSTPELYAHCVRTWAFSAMFAARDEITHDRELLYVACLLHDLGLTEAHNAADPAARCFAVEGGRAARELMCRHGASEQRAVTVAEAITLHLNVTVPARMGPEAHLLSKGVSLDTIGRGLHRMPRGSLDQVDARWSRKGSTEHLVAVTRRQAELRPGSRAAFLHGLGFAALLRANPLDHDRAPAHAVG